MCYIDVNDIYLSNLTSPVEVDGGGSLWGLLGRQHHLQHSRHRALAARCHGYPALMNLEVSRMQTSTCTAVTPWHGLGANAQEAIEQA